MTRNKLYLASKLLVMKVIISPHTIHHLNILLKDSIWRPIFFNNSVARNELLDVNNKLFINILFFCNIIFFTTNCFLLRAEVIYHWGYWYIIVMLFWVLMCFFKVIICFHHKLDYEQNIHYSITIWTSFYTKRQIAFLLVSHFFLCRFDRVYTFYLVVISIIFVLTLYLH